MPANVRLQRESTRTFMITGYENVESIEKFWPGGKGPRPARCQATPGIIVGTIRVPEGPSAQAGHNRRERPQHRTRHRSEASALVHL